jgi:hypothetical protein
VTQWVSSRELNMRFIWAAIALMIFLGVTLPAILASRKADGGVPNRSSVRQLAAWSVCIGALVPLYLVAFWAWHFYGRYTAPLLVVTIPGVAALAVLAGRRLTRLPTAMLALSPVVFLVLALAQLHRGRMVLDLPINAGFVHYQLDRNRLVGAAQSGIVGFFNENVINLDGKIDPQALSSMRRGGVRTLTCY